MATFKRDRAALAVARGDYYSDAVVAQELGICRRTIERYRDRAARDPELAAMIAGEKVKLRELWRERLPVAMTDVEEAIRRYARKDEHTPAEMETLIKAGEMLSRLQFAAQVFDERFATGGFVRIPGGTRLVRRANGGEVAGPEEYDDAMEGVFFKDLPDGTRQYYDGFGGKVPCPHHPQYHTKPVSGGCVYQPEGEDEEPDDQD